MVSRRVTAALHGSRFFRASRSYSVALEARSPERRASEPLATPRPKSSLRFWLAFGLGWSAVYAVVIWSVLHVVGGHAPSLFSD